MQTKTFLRAGSSFCAFSLLLCALTAPLPAWAGFQWVAPGDADQGGYAGDSTSSSRSGSSPSVPSAPADSSTFQLAPQIVEGPAPSVSGSSPSIASTTTSAPLGVSPESVPAPSPSQTLPTPSAPAAEKEKTVRGFANNVPLSVALRQVLPQEYGFSVAQDISLSTQVSWRGGAPWRQVLKDMLSPAGLTTREEDQMIQVVRSTEAAGSGNLADPAPSRYASAEFDSGKPTSLVPPPSSESRSSRKGRGLSRSLDSLPTRSVSDGGAHSSPTMGYLVPPADAREPAPARATSPSFSSASAGGGRAGAYDVWTAEKGDMLHKVLETWARRAGVELSWQAEYDYPLQASVFLSGSFEDVVRALLVGFQEAKPRPVGQLYQNQMAGQSVLVVQALGNNYDE